MALALRLKLTLYRLNANGCSKLQNYLLQACAFFKKPLQGLVLADAPAVRPQQSLKIL